MTSNNKPASLPVKQRIEGLITRAVDTTLESIDAESRTLTVSFSSETPYLRVSWFDDPWVEVLGHKAGEVELDRANSSAPVLYNHIRNDNGSRLGVIEKAWVDRGKGFAKIKLSQRDEVNGFWQDIQDGILGNISVGYQINERTLTKKNMDSPDEYRVTSWTPMEISFVDIPADYTVGVSRNFQIIDLEVKKMADADQNQKTDKTRAIDPQQQAAIDPPTEKPAGNDKPEPTANDQEISRKVAEAVEQQRKLDVERRTAIRTNLAPFANRFPDVLTKALDDSGISVDQASALMLKAAGDGMKATGSTLSHIELTRDEQETSREGHVDYLLNRSMPSQFKMTDNGKRYVGSSMVDIAKRILGGKLDGMTKDEIITRALSTSDFPAILANVANKTLRAAYEIMPRTYLPLANTTTVSDFKTITRAQISGTPLLEETLEGAEHKYGKLTDAKEQYAVKTYGKILKFTRQALVNDDLGAFTRIAQQFAASAAQLESDLAWGQITGNPVMGDGTALFHATHKNLDATAAAISIASLGSGRAKMRNQTGLEGMVLNLAPSYLIVPTSLELVAQQFVANTNIIYTKNPDYNPFAGTLQVITEPRLDANSATAWYLATTPMLVDILELAYLEGENGLYTEERYGFEVDGWELKARLDVGAKIIDWRGLVKNPGV